MKIIITINNIEVHNGTDFKGTPWKNKMQVIYSDMGLFLDNIEGNCFNKSGIKWKGIDWTQYKGEKKEIIIVNCAGKVIESFTPCNTIEELTRDLGKHHFWRSHGCSNHLWAYPFFLLGEPVNINRCNK